MLVLGFPESCWNADFSTFARDDHTSFVSYDRARNSGSAMFVEVEVSTRVQLSSGRRGGEAVGAGAVSLFFVKLA